MNFRELVEVLDERGELLTVTNEVSGEYELPELLRQAEERGSACRFDRVAGAAFPVVGGVLTSLQRLALGLGLPEDSFDMPDSLAAYIAQAVTSPVAANVVATGPVADVAIERDSFDTGILPAPLFFSGDSHPFISAGVGFVIDPENDTQNVGFYRAPIIDAQRISLSTGPSSDMRRIYNWHRERGEELRVALAVGVSPALQIAAAADLAATQSDVDVAGALQNEPVDLIKCQTSDILVPADAEIVIEATVELENWVENTMGEYGDLYGTTTSPVARIDRVTHRNDALFHVIMAGMNREHNQLGSMLGWRLRTGMLEQLARSHPVVRDLSINMTPRRTGMRSQVTVAIDKTDDAQPAAIIDEIFALRIGRIPLSVLVQRVVVVDEDIDIRDAMDVEWAIASRTITSSQVSAVEDRTGRGAVITRLGFDATAPLAERARLTRPEIPSAANYDLDRYLGGDK